VDPEKGYTESGREYAALFLQKGGELDHDVLV